MAVSITLRLPFRRIRSSTRQKIDHLAELRALIRQAQEAERELTSEVIGMLEAGGVDRLLGAQAEARLEQRTNLRPDPELFLQATGPAGYGALSVSVTAARRLMAADNLAAISETVTTSVLRVESIAPDQQPAAVRRSDEPVQSAAATDPEGVLAYRGTALSRAGDAPAA